MLRSVIEPRTGGALLDCGHTAAPDAAVTPDARVDCADCEALTLPQTASHYRSTPEFTRDTLPAGLQRDHRTRDGTWGMIEVFEGAIEYFVTEPFEAHVTVQAGERAAIPPLATHYIEPRPRDGALRLRVDFYSVSGR